MSEHSPRRFTEEEQRLIVLYALNAFAPCTEGQLLQFMSDNNLMNYFDMMIAVNALCANGQAVRLRKTSDPLLGLTEAGQEALILFGGRIPHSAQKILADKAETMRSLFHMEAQCEAKVSMNAKDDYELKLALYENEFDMMRLSLFLPTSKMANQLARRWPKKAAEIYRMVMLILSEDDK